MASVIYSTLTQIKNIIIQLNKKNYNSIYNELKELTDIYGDDAKLYILHYLLDDIDVYKYNSNDINVILLKDIIKLYSNNNNFIHLISNSLEIKNINKLYLDTFFTIFNTISFNQQILISLSLIVSNSCVDESLKFLKSKIADIVSGKNEYILTNNVLHELLFNIRTNLGFTVIQKQSLLLSLQKIYTDVDISIKPLLYSMEELNSKLKFADINNSPSSKALNFHLSDIFYEIGYTSMDNLESCRQIISQFSTHHNITESEISRVIGMIVRYHTGLYEIDSNLSKTWNYTNFLTALQQVVPSISWIDVYRQFDYPEFHVPDIRALSILFECWQFVTRHTLAFPIIELFFTEFRNIRGRLSLLRVALDAPVEMINFAALPRSQRSIDGIVSSQAALSKPGVANGAWSSLLFLEALLNMSETELYISIRALFKIAIENCPELLLCGLATVQPTGQTLREELFTSMFPTYLIGTHPHSNSLLFRLWQLTPQLLVRYLVKSWSENRAFLTRALEIIHELKQDSLTIILDVKTFAFALDLASLAFKKDLLNLEKWLSSKLQELGNVFAASCLEFLRENMSRIQMAQQGRPSANVLSNETMSTFFKVLFSAQQILSTEINADLQHFYSLCAHHITQSSQNMVPPNTTTASGLAPSVLDEIDEEANSYFVKVYRSEISIEDVMTILKRFQSSNIERERKVFACMVQNIFQEYQFYEKYPEGELKTTAILFGTLIQQKLLIPPLVLGVALRCILDSLKKSPDTKFFRFAIWALENFESFLPEVPYFCSLVLQIPHLQSTHPVLVENLNRLSKSSTISSLDAETTQTIVSTINSTFDEYMLNTVSSALSAQSTLGNAKKGEVSVSKSVDIAAPVQPIVNGVRQFTFAPREVLTNIILDSEINNRLNFLFNSVSKNNIDAKSKEIKIVLAPEHYSYLALNLIVKRVTVEQNLHKVYLALLDSLKIEELFAKVIDYTYNNILAMLLSETILTSQKDRTNLKNLASWLGKLTLGRNKPVLAKKIDVKALILDAYERNRFVAVIPFVAKLLEATTTSRVFKLPNPWLVQILGLLVETYQVAKLKLNLNFEIEVLFDNLLIKISDIKPTIFLKDLQVREESASQQDDDKPDDTDPYRVMSWNISSTIALFTKFPNLKNDVPIAIGRAINEIINPVVERSVTIACITTRELIVKDFAMEPDASKMRAAAHQMVQALTSSLSLVTCKEPLRVSMVANLQKLFQSTPGVTAETELLELACAQLSSDNIDLASSAIEKNASERAIIEIDDSLSQHYSRRTLGEQAGAPHYDTSIFQHGRFPAQFPDILRPKPSSSTGGLSALQLRVYEDFSRPIVASTPSVSTSGDSSPSLGSFRGQQTSVPELATAKPFTPAEPPVVEDLNAVQCLDKLTELSTNIEQRVALRFQTLQHQGGALSNLSALLTPEDAALISTSFSQILKRCVQSQRDEASVGFGLKTLKRLIDNRSAPIAIDLFIRILKSLLQYQNRTPSGSVKLVADMTALYLQQHEEIKFFRDLLVPLLRERIISINEFNLHLAQALVIASSSSAATAAGISMSLILIDLAVIIIRLLVINEKVSTSMEWINVLDVLSKIAQHQRANNTNKAFNDRLIQFLQQVEEFEASAAASAPNTTIRKPELSDAVEAENNLRTAGAQPVVSPFAVIEKLRKIGKLSPEDVPSIYLSFYDDNAEEPPSENLKVATSALFDHWMSLLELSSSDNNIAYAQFLATINQQGLLKGESNVRKFFRCCIERCIDTDNELHQQCSNNTSYPFIDALSKLIIFLVKYSAEQSKFVLLATFLHTVVRSTVAMHERLRSQFNQRPIFRLFSNFLLDVTDASDVVNNQILILFAHAMYALRPTKTPGFTFAWVELISHKNFMPKLLAIRNSELLAVYQSLLLSLLQFMEPYLSKVEMPESIKLLYKGCLRLLLVLAHDFPEFLCEFHFSLIEALPPSCVQLRNLILSAFPREIRMVDPFTPQLVVDQLPEIRQAPLVLSDFTISILEAPEIKVELDSFIRRRQPAFLVKLVNYCQVKDKNEVKYNVPFINSLVFYVGMQGVALLQNSENNVANSAPTDILIALLNSFDAEGRYIVLNAMANHLRYPNNHTHFFSSAILHIFTVTQIEAVQEQITRVLLDRLIVNRPHPWGLLVTFVELIKNPRYDIWSHSFTRCDPEIEKLFERMARSAAPGQPNA